MPTVQIALIERLLLLFTIDVINTYVVRRILIFLHKLQEIIYVYAQSFIMVHSTSDIRDMQRQPGTEYLCKKSAAHIPFGEPVDHRFALPLSV